MNEVTYSKHAETRMQQRGLRPADLELILKHGSRLGEEVYFLSGKDVTERVNQLKAEIQCLERLNGKKLVLVNDVLVTCYSSSKRNQKCMYRRAKEWS